MWRKWNSPTLLLGMQIGTATMENSIEIPQKLKIELPYELAIPLLGIYPKKILIQKDSCTSLFIAVLFTIAKSWEPPKCAPTDEWIKKVWHIYTLQYLLFSHEKEQNMPFAATWMQSEIIILSEVSQRKTNTIWYHLYIESKIWHIYLWNRKDSQT